MFGLTVCVMSPDLVDSVELERTVANLHKELIAAREAEDALKGQLASLQLLPNQVHNLLEQVRFPPFLETLLSSNYFYMMHNSCLISSWSRVNSKNHHWKKK